MVEQLMGHVAADSKDLRGFSPLHWVFGEHQTNATLSIVELSKAYQVVDRLLLSGADPFAEDRRGIHPFQIMVSKATDDHQFMVVFKNRAMAMSRIGTSLLHLTASYLQWKFIKNPLASQENINSQDNSDSTPTHAFIGGIQRWHQKDPEFWTSNTAESAVLTARALAHYGPDLTLRDRRGQTPIPDLILLCPPIGSDTEGHYMSVFNEIIKLHECSSEGPCLCAPWWKLAITEQKWTVVRVALMKHGSSVPSNSLRWPSGHRLLVHALRIGDKDLLSLFIQPLPTHFQRPITWELTRRQRQLFIKGESPVVETPSKNYQSSESSSKPDTESLAATIAQFEHRKWEEHLSPQTVHDIESSTNNEILLEVLVHVLQRRDSYKIYTLNGYNIHPTNAIGRGINAVTCKSPLASLSLLDDLAAYLCWAKGQIQQMSPDSPLPRSFATVSSVEFDHDIERVIHEIHGL
jgi:hypothetical protein